MAEHVHDMDVDTLANPETTTKDQLLCRIDCLQQENLVLKTELEISKQRIKHLLQENEELRRNSVAIQAKAEEEEEYISNTLMKQIHTLKKEKETLAVNYEQEEEFLTNDLSRKLCDLQKEKLSLEKSLEKEQQAQVSKLMLRIEKLESDVKTKQQNLETLRREKVALENTLEQEQEALVNRLWKKMECFEADKRILQERLDSITSAEGDSSGSAVHGELGGRRVRHSSNGSSVSDGGIVVLPPNESASSESMAQSVARLRDEVICLRQRLAAHEEDHPRRMQTLRQEELSLIEENRQLRRRLQYEVQQRQELTRHLSESEGSVDVDKSRFLGDLSVDTVAGTAELLNLPNVASNMSLSSNFSLGSRFSTQAQAGSLASLSSNASSFVKPSSSPVSVEDKLLSDL